MPLPLSITVQTPRLTLRPLAQGDLADLLEINGDDAVTRFLPYATWRSPEDGAAWLARMEARTADGMARQLVIVQNSDAKVVGTLLIFKLDEGSARAELGYVIGRRHWRHGYAREAVGAMCVHAFSRLGLRRLEAEVNPDNVASNALLDALGFVREGRLRQRWVGRDGAAYDTFVYGLLREDLKSRG